MIWMERDERWKVNVLIATQFGWFLFDIMNFSPNLIHLSKTHVNPRFFGKFLLPWSSHPPSEATPRSESSGWWFLQGKFGQYFRGEELYLGEIEFCAEFCAQVAKLLFLVQIWNGLFDGTNKDTSFRVLVGIMESLWWRPYLKTELEQKMPPWPAFQDRSFQPPVFFFRAKGGRSGGLAYVAVVALLGLDPTFQLPVKPQTAMVGIKYVNLIGLQTLRSKGFSTGIWFLAYTYGILNSWNSWNSLLEKNFVTKVGQEQYV